jgi:hypothetical protein
VRGECHEIFLCLYRIVGGGGFSGGRKVQGWLGMFETPFLFVMERGGVCMWHVCNSSYKYRAACAFFLSHPSSSMSQMFAQIWIIQFDVLLFFSATES